MLSEVTIKGEQVKIKWEYEDNLSEDISDLVYNKMFSVSKVIDGVRMFPYITFNNKKYFLMLA